MKTIIIDGVEYNLTPKAAFHEGDWVIDKQGIVHQVANVVENATNHTYGYDIVCGGYFNDNAEGVRLWNISDAKDGDVLYDGNAACILRKTMEDEDDDIWIDAYCGINIDNEFKVNDEDECWCLACDCVPATKEQHDLLFRKMKEAGYEWDAEKKELKKIRQKPTWSEEDEKRIKNIISVLDVQVCWNGATGKKENPYQKEIEWLNKLKEL